MLKVAFIQIGFFFYRSTFGDVIIEELKSNEVGSWAVKFDWKQQ